MISLRRLRRPEDRFWVHGFKRFIAISPAQIWDSNNRVPYAIGVAIRVCRPLAVKGFGFRVEGSGLFGYSRTLPHMQNGKFPEYCLDSGAI